MLAAPGVPVAVDVVDGVRVGEGVLDGVKDCVGLAVLEGVKDGVGVGRVPVGVMEDVEVLVGVGDGP